MEDIWKEAFPVGTEWDQYDKVYEIDWDFSNLEEAFEDGGPLHDKRVYLFGCTEPQLVHFKSTDKVIHIPAVVAVLSPFPPSEQLGIKSVQMETELIVPMREMKMGWIPFIPEDISDRKSVERFKAQVFTLKCTQRRAALRQLKQERVKKYEYCLPYLYNPLKEDETQYETTVSIMYPLEGDEQAENKGERPPVVCDFDWQFDEVEEFTDNLIEEEALPAAEKDKFMAFVKENVNEAKGKIREAKKAHKLAKEAMSEDTKKAFEAMRFLKFYPTKSEGAPDISHLKSSYINRYYGKAHEVL